MGAAGRRLALKEVEGGQWFCTRWANDSASPALPELFLVRFLESKILKLAVERSGVSPS